MLGKLGELRVFSESIAARFMLQLLSAVSYCHSKKVVHRDLKLENLMLEVNDINSNMKVIDFGTSRIFKNFEKMSEIMGTVILNRRDCIGLLYCP